jgi:S-DNA-T family DNA segregation ATPase FtsK/SpoIIIE
MARIPRLGEALGVVLLSASLILGLSLISHTPGDPSFFTHAGSGSAHNLVGRFGATLSDGFLQLFGLGSYVIAIFGGWLGIRRLFGRPSPSLLATAVGASGLVIGLQPLLHLLIGRGFLGAGLDAGGVTGAIIGGWLRSWMNPLGAVLFCLTAVTVTAIVSTQVSFPRVIVGVSGITGTLARRIRTRLARWSEHRRKERMRKQVIRKQQERQKAISAQSPKLAPPKAPQPPPARPPERPHPGSPGMAERKDAGSPAAGAPTQARLPIGRGHRDFALPPTSLFSSPPASAAVDDRELFARAKLLTEKCREFGVDGNVIEIHPGPVVTTFEFKPEAGIKYSKIVGLSDDLCLALSAESVRIDRISGKSTVGIEVPNTTRETIYIREVLESDQFRRSHSKLALAIGKRIDGEVYVTDRANLPHMLFAGATGAGKSVTLNAIIASILCRSTPDEVKFIFIDTKRLELGIYENIPHLLTPVVAEAKKASNALKWATAEMERRYKLLSGCNVRNIDHYNAQIRKGQLRQSSQALADGADALKPLPYIMVVIDELADLMILAAREVEDSITRLAQMARAVGIHLVLSTQRPSVDVITGVIKANLPSRIALRVSSKVDSRTIIDGNGAEKLLGAGDMLFLPPGSARLIRVHASYITDNECQALAEYLRKQARPEFDESVTVEKRKVEEFEGEAEDAVFPEAVRLAIEMKQISASHLQRRLRLGYARAARLVDMMEARGIVGPAEGSKPREVLVGQEYIEQMAAGAS